MKVLVLGSGVIGTTCAWYLQRAGHEVTVIDRHDEPAMETSFANGGQISWSAASPWAAPDIPWRVLTWLFKRHSPLVLRMRLDPAMWAWLARALANCTPQRHARNKERLLRIASYSHICLGRLRREIGIHYEERRNGTLQIFRGRHALAAAVRDAAILDHMGIRYRALDRAGCLAVEPGLAAAVGRIAGGIHFPDDEVGDCRVFTQQLAWFAGKNGVVFRGGVTIERLVADGRRIAHIETDRGVLSADAYVLACGSYSPLLVRPLGIRLPVYPVKGYSITVPLAEADAAPVGSLTDESHKVVITRLGDKIRAAGTAELAGYDLALPPSRVAILVHVLRELFPRGADLERAEPWTGLRPMTPDNPPVLGPTPYENLFLNTGHGTLGWTLACGSGKVLADLVSGRDPDIDIEGLTLARYG